MTIVFWVLVLYGLSFLYLAVTSDRAELWASPVDADQPLAFPVRFPVRSEDPSEVVPDTGLAM